MYLRFALLVFVALAASARPVQAQLLDFTFTTTADDGAKIVGEIDGLAASGTSTPTQIIITSQPAGYTFGAPNVLSIATGYQFLAGFDTFTVTSGVITGASLGIYKTIGTQGDLQGYGFNVTTGGFTGANGIYQTIGNTNGSGGVVTADFNTNGLAGTSFALVTPVPEPRQTALIFLLAGMGLLMGRKLHGKFRGTQLQANS